MLSVRVFLAHVLRLGHLGSRWHGWTTPLSPGRLVDHRAAHRLRSGGPALGSAHGLWPADGNAELPSVSGLPLRSRWVGPSSTSRLLEKLLRALEATRTTPAPATGRSVARQKLATPLQAISGTRIWLRNKARTTDFRARRLKSVVFLRTGLCNHIPRSLAASNFPDLSTPRPLRLDQLLFFGI
jgi:hypothetical protein